MSRGRLAPSLSPGDVLGGCVVVREAAGGGASRVYLAMDAEGAAVALKVLGPEAAQADFLREAALLAELEHPSIVRYLAHGIAEEGTPGLEPRLVPYLVMEWLEGEELGARLGRGPLPEDEARALLRRTAEGLGAAHARGVVHADVTPSNLFLERGEAASAKLIDFGIAIRQKASLGAAARAADPRARGTAGYVAPEELLGAAPSPRGDVFALGCVVHEALSGEPAFPADHALGAHARALSSPPPRLDEGAGKGRVSAGLAALVARMLAREPSARPADGSALLREIASLEPGAGAARVSRRPMATEKRLVSAVVVEAPSSPGRLAAGELDPDPQIAAIAARRGAFSLRLSPRAAALRVDAKASPLEAAIFAAEAALALAEGEPPRRASLVTGLFDPSEPEAFEALLTEAASALDAPDDAEAPRVVADAKSARLLEERFGLAELGGARGGVRLLGEPPPWPPRRALSCVGRDAELALLEASFAQCEAEPMARGLLVTGAAGSGKSRLVEELCARLGQRPSPPAILFGRGDPRFTEIPCRVLAGALAPGALSGPASEGPRGREALVRELAVACARGPVVFVLEDLQWADEASVEAVSSALAELASAPLFVVAVGRPEVHASLPGLLEGRGLEEIRVGGIGGRASERLVREALGKDTPDALVRSIAQRAAGNAFFLEEIIRAVAAGRGDHLPDGVVGAVQARLDGLGEESKRVLRAASVFGARFGKAGLSELLPDLGEHAAEAALSALVRAEVIAAAPEDADAFAFRHEIVQEAVHATLTGVDRARGHLLAGLWLERRGAGDALALARHFDAGGAPARAAAHYRRAAEQCLEAGELEAALDHAERVAAAGAVGEELGRVRLVESEALRWRGDGGASIACGREAAALLPKGSDAWFAAMGNVILGLGRKLRAEEAEGATLAALAATPLGLPRAKIACLAKAAFAMALLANRAFTERVLAIAERLGSSLDPRVPGDGPVLGELLHARAALELSDGNPFGALEAERRALALHEQAGDARGAAMAEGYAACAYVELGAYDLAVAALERVLAVAERLGHAMTAAWARLNLCHALGLKGERARALVEGEAAQRAFAGRGELRLEAASLLYAARAHLAAGDASSALASADEAAARADLAPAVLASARSVRAAVLLARGEAEAALPLAEEAWALLVEHGAFETGESFVRLIHAEALAQSGRGGASEALQEAAARLRARAARIGDPALRASFLAIPENARTLALAER